MLQRLITPLLLVAAGLAAHFSAAVYNRLPLEKLATSFFVGAGFFFLRAVLAAGVNEYIHSSKRRYTFRKTLSLVLLVVTLIMLLQIWVEDPQALLVAYGLVAAGVAVSLQDVFKNLAGGIVILVTRLYRVGNRIEIDGRVGDVIDVGIFYTTLLEVGDWVRGDQSTGRITSLPNGKVLAGVVNNYSRDHQFLWDEIMIPITYESDMAAATELLTSVATQHTEGVSDEARRSITHMERRYYLSERNMKPTVFVQATDNWVALTVRYPVAVRERRAMQSQITAEVVEQIQEHDSITIASETLDIVDFPGAGN